MSDLLETPPVHARKRSRWLPVLLLLVPVLLLAGGYLYLTLAAQRQLREAAAEVDRLDPHWRFKDIEAARADVPDERNGAALVLKARALLPGGWPSWDLGYTGPDPDGETRRKALEKSFMELTPQRQLNEDQRDALRAELKRAAAALAEARKLKDYPEGRYALTYSTDLLSTPVPHVQPARAVVYLIQFDILLRAQEGDADGALESCRAILNCARSLGDEPFLVSQMVRMALRAIVVSPVQRTLAEGEPSDAALRPLQELLEDETAAPLMLIGTRGERAVLDQSLEAIETGKSKMTARDLLKAAAASAVDGPPESAGGPAALLDDLALRSNAGVTSQRAALLRYMTRAVEVAKLPPERQYAGYKELEADRKDQPLLVRVLAPLLTKVAEADRRSGTQLRCAAVALAAERYRRDRGRWPDGPGALVAAGYLRGVPTDLYDGRPLRWRRLDDGVVVYSVGPHGKDHGGRMDFHDALAPDTNLGFRLWDVKHRRRPPGEAPAADGK
jgi:hypothetical protein